MTQFFSVFMVVIFLSSGFAMAVPTARGIEFFLQPHESAGTECTYTKTDQPHGYLVTCGARKFRVHHFTRLHSNSTQNQWEILFWVTHVKNDRETEYVGTSVWIKADTKSNIQTIKLSQAIDNDTGTLDLTIN